MKLTCKAKYRTQQRVVCSLIFMTLKHAKICLVYRGDKNHFLSFFTDSNIVKKRVRVIAQKIAKHTENGVTKC